MSEVIVITSGKGGVGKTTTTANIGVRTIAVLGKKVHRDRHRSWPQESGCSYGTGKPYRLQSGGCDRRKLPIESRL